MFRFRRYRALVVCAFVITVLLYHVSKNSQWDHSREMWHPGPKSRPQRPLDNQPNPDLGAAGKVPHGVKAPTKTQAPPKTTQAATVPDRKLPSHHDGSPKRPVVGDSAAEQQDGDAAPTSTAIHWKKPKEWFPIPEQELIMLPTGTPKRVPTIQFAFPKESPADKEKREERLAKIKAEAKRAWYGYRKYAWTHDELTPVTKGARNPFCGWAATMVDSLDTLWIMGLKDEFEEAVEAVKDIDFTTTPWRDDIPVFETIIRYLGGLIGAYDVTGRDPKYRSLLDKAVELAEILMSVFDTPNRLPILYYSWKPEFNVNPKRASTSAGVAELGSMSMEFTRLAQLTGKHKYYDAIARITDAFEDLQNRKGATAIPGIFPENLDASGCNRTAARLQKQAAQNQADDTLWQRSLAGGSGSGQDPAVAYDVQPNAEPGSGDSHPLRKRLPPQRYPASFRSSGLPEGWDCVPQNLTGSSSYASGAGSYSMGGSQDSAYEYFPKQYLLLGGLVPKYRTMHEKTVDAVKEYLLFRPMAEGDPDVLFSAKAYSSDGTTKQLSYQWEVTHLTCFLGGMFGLGGKIFDRPDDVEIGKKLADGCVWAYDVMPTGIMPEYATVLPCRDMVNCKYDEKEWYRALDPNYDMRDRQAAEYYEKLDQWKKQEEKWNKEQALQKQAAEQGRRSEADKEAAARAAGRSEQPAADAAEDAQQRPESGFQKRDVDANGAPVEKQWVLPPKPVKPESHLEYVTAKIKREHIPSGFVSLNDKRYILRPEAIESVWYMYRITGDKSWQEKGWRMFEAVIRATSTEVGHSAIHDVAVTDSKPKLDDSMESFWLAETLKYFYLLFETPDVISLDEWVLNTEAHPFRRPT
ncbi:hypothetical protein VTJ83DRAFT_3166 [Remersonia thermophila]|uniref:alpha-1,2-Mannosidase n=1 Tax=Remersonia thermophila TaxID=72144 RepID=A0ABR4DDW8_9PEZI